MKPVVICQGASSAVLYVQECRRREIEPIIINVMNFGSDPSSNKLIGNDVTIIDVYDWKYEDILKKVKEIDPCCVVCGCGGAPPITDRLARDLGLRGNDPATTRLRDTKDGMHEALKNAGIRYIKTAAINDKTDIIEFWKKDIKKVIIKFASGAGSVGNKVCNSLEESLGYYDIILKMTNMYGERDKILIQEFIEGDEFVVDTVSCEGKHTVSAIWKYNKILTNDQDIVYDETKLIVHPQPGTLELVRYAFKVLDATGFEFGPCHGEYKIDEKGPVLIETNARPHGGTLSAEFLDECLDNHITDLALDSYLSPETFRLNSKRLYRPKKYAIFKHLISPKECDINLVTLKKVLSHMKSYRYSNVEITDEVVHLHKTVDCESSPAILKLCNSDYVQLRDDCDFLFTLETKFFDLIEAGDMKVEGKELKTSIDMILSYLPIHWKVLVMTDKGEYLSQYGKKIEKVDANGYDVIVYADSSGSTVAKKMESIMCATSRACESGVIMVVPEVYENLPYKGAAIEVILNLSNCMIEIPPLEKNIIIGTRY